jgi:hypothetical protein
MKRKTLPPAAAAQPSTSHAHAPLQRTPDTQSQDQLPLMPSTGPDYQDMADQSQVVQAAGLLQQAADALTAPDVDGPVLQGCFIWKGKLINDKTYAAFKNDLDASLVTAKLSQEIKRQGPRGKAAAAELASRVQAIMELAMAPEEADDELATADNKEELIRLAKNQMALAEQSDLSAATDADGRVVMDPEVQKMMQTLLKLGAFPLDNVKDLANQAGQRGFRKELELAYALATTYADLGGRVQCGVLHGMDPIELLGNKYYVPQKRKGQVGADVVVWFPIENEQKQKTTFIQSKATSESNMRKHAIAAANQLAGKNASGTTDSNNSAVKEYTYEGGEFERVVFVSISDCSDIGNADRAAAAAFGAQSKFVSKVVIEVESEPAYYTYLPGKKYVRTDTNPLLGTGAARPLGPDEKEQLPPPPAKAPVKPATDEADEELLEMETNVAMARSLLPQPTPYAQPQRYQEIKVKDPQVALAAAVNVSEDADASEHEDEDEVQVVATPAAAAASASAVPAAKPAKSKGSHKPKRLTKSQKKKAALKKAQNLAKSTAPKAKGDDTPT